MYQDKTLICKECGTEFLFSAGEQEFYAARGFQNEPQRCKSCRDARRNAARGPVSISGCLCGLWQGARVPSSPSQIGQYIAVNALQDEREAAP